MPDRTLTQPNELLSLVFLLGFYSYPLHSALVTHYLNAITLVSWRWRTVAVDTARLWTTVLYRPAQSSAPNKNHSSVDSLRAYYTSILLRSKEVSLDIVYEPLGKDDPLDRAFLDLLLPHIQRCRTIHVDYTVGDSSPRHLLPLPGAMSRLEELYIWGKGVYEDFPPVLVAEATNQSPLTTLHVYNRGLFDTSSISSTILSDLCVNGIVELHPPLEERRLWSFSAHTLTSLFSSSGFDAANIPRVELPNLFRVGAPLLKASLIPKAIVCSNVQELVLFEPQHRRLPRLSRASRDIVFPWPRLHSVIVNDSYGALFPILAALPTVTSLTCFEHRVEEDYMGYLIGQELADTSEGSEKMVVPKLKTFTLEPPAWDDRDGDVPVYGFYNMALDLFTARPELSVHCLRHRVDGAAVLVRKELHRISELYPHRFTFLDTPPMSLEYLYMGSLKLDSTVSQYQLDQLAWERRRETGRDEEEDEDTDEEEYRHELGEEDQYEEADDDSET